MTDVDETYAPDDHPALDEYQRRRFTTSYVYAARPVEAAAETESTAAPPPSRAQEHDGSGPRGLPIIDWSATGSPELAPRLLSFPKPPPGEAGGWRENDALPEADVVVMTWTSDEWDALHYVFSNTLEPLPASSEENKAWRSKWYPYQREFHTVFSALWTRRLISERRNRPGGAPSLADRRWGSFCMIEVAGKRVLLFKSELHINQDGESMPLRQLVRQILDECRPNLLLSVGTAGGVRLDDVLGDVVVTNAAKFRFGDEFCGASCNHTIHRCLVWSPPERYVAAASKLLMAVPEQDVLPPTAHYPNGAVLRPSARGPKIHLLPDQPILTTDFFEYGTTTNELWREGCCVEMDDAVIAMVCGEHRPETRYGFVRNVSDPVINGNLPRSLQTAWAVVTYAKEGLHTSYNSAIATWAMIAAS